MAQYRVVEICAGAGGQSLGLELAGFGHDLSVELDANAAATFRHNRPHWKVAVGDVANPEVWNPADYGGVVRNDAGTRTSESVMCKFMGQPVVDIRIPRSRRLLRFGAPWPGCRTRVLTVSWPSHLGRSRA